MAHVTRDGLKKDARRPCPGRPDMRDETRYGGPIGCGSTFYEMDWDFEKPEGEREVWRCTNCGDTHPRRQGGRKKGGRRQDAAIAALRDLAEWDAFEVDRWDSGTVFVKAEKKDGVRGAFVAGSIGSGGKVRLDVSDWGLLGTGRHEGLTLSQAIRWARIYLGLY